ncbi:hypothetical protein SAMN04488074_105103 [Lentzea albidocapillata subsp. violacea]|uniref:Uncharacterized protein n=1 Tax=Lentzea albidocapillata subsp. violacea TaxID=128104 RepID=A0A1G9AT89_9PSEU|nr:hypothetical protein [Lentzea albidocapillata]SDK30094.1 hypothetical protein SAMN04488074_105103 [Lentzea albidocapillata subsp. violacea]
MIIKYKPSDGDEQVWDDFDPNKVFDDAAEEIEYHYRGTFDEFHVGILQGQTRARRVLLWHLQRLIHPTLAYADLPRFERRAFTIELDRDELLSMRKQTENATLPAADREKALAYIDTELAKHITPEDVAAKGKASPSGATNTPSKSPSTSTSRRPSNKA